MEHTPVGTEVAPTIMSTILELLSVAGVGCGLAAAWPAQGSRAFGLAGGPCIGLCMAEDSWGAPDLLACVSQAISQAPVAPGL